ncbi:amidohydrolase family protein [Terrabacter sp. GCM10028922]|uniref:amidohydrolase family protein n=1 Tax=Terrabacter sp. GCM10028922 TaxID=3273428 RepID=UPI00361470D7
MREHGPRVAPAPQAAGWPATWRTALDARTGEGTTIDVHGHLWPEELVDALRRRSSVPRLEGWVLHLDGEAPLRLNPDDHDVVLRGSLEPDSRGLCLLSLSSPLGIESLPTAQAAPLLDAWHAGVARLPEPFAAWASVAGTEPDLQQLKHHLQTRFVGLQVPASWLATPSLLETHAPTLAVCEAEGRPVFVHPGPAGLQQASRLPAWWPSVVAYSTQLQAAWWSWHQVGRSLMPDLPICFAAGAGLAPTHHERLVARGGAVGRIDRGVFVETSSYGRQAIDALTRVLGVDGIVLGSDRPYGRPVDAEALGLGRAAARAIESTNPRRLLLGGTP